jgi:hypothetical protein
LLLKNFVRQILIIATIVIVLSEIWASTEEYMFTRNVTENSTDILDNSGTVFKDRWWPFTTNYMSYCKDDGFNAGD